MKPRFLLDENLSLKLKKAIHRRYSEIDVIRVGDEGAPPLGTLDPDILHYLEANQRILLTDNRHSMPMGRPFCGRASPLGYFYCPQKCACWSFDR